MAMVIKPKRKFTAGAPTTSDIVEGEIAINTADKKLYVRDNANTIIEIGGGGAGGSTTEVTQSSHGLSAKDAIRHNGTAWVKAQADDGATLALGIVTEAATNTFTVAQSGRFTISSHGLTVGQWYYLDASTAGALTATEPTISQPLVYVESANVIFVYPYRPTNLIVNGTASVVPGDNTVTSAKIVNGTIVTADLADDAITSAKIADDAITSALIADDAVVTAAIADDAITSALIADDAITSALIADDAVVTAAIADDAITSALIADDAVGADQLAASAVVTASIVDDSVTQAKIADDAVTLAKMASGTDGNIISYDASGNPVAIVTGNAGQVLTSAGAGSPPTFADAAGGGLSLQATPKTANFTAVAGEQYIVDTSSSAFTMTFPASPSVGDTVGVIDYAGTFHINNLALGRNSVNVLRAAADGVINTQNWSTNWMYVHATPGWLPVG
jgi:hypothetical protein